MKKLKRTAALLSAAAMTAAIAAIPGSASAVSSDKSVEQIVSEMSTKQKIEQMIIISLRNEKGGPGEDVTELNEEQMNYLREHNFGGVALFAENVQNIEQSVKLNTQLQQAAMESEFGIPMLISADQEGGSIFRIGTGTPTSGNMALGATWDPICAYENARILGKELAALGINNNFGPVMDVNNNPANPVIGVRSFSSVPSLVCAMGMEYIEGLHDEGIITTCKHFPGHGDTGTDSHTGLPLIDKSYDELKVTELMPYLTAVTYDTDMIMTAHIQFPQIENSTYTSKKTGEEVYLPATLSKTMITDILRGDYEFDGVITTDAMMMDAIKVHFDPVDAAVLAINADVDMLLEPVFVKTSEDMKKMDEYVENIEKQVEAGNIPEETINKSVTRILEMKKERGILDYKAPSLENALATVGSAENRENALKVAERGITLVKNDDDLLPLKLDENGKVAYFFPYANVEKPMDFTLERLKKEGVVADGVTADCIWYRGHNAAEYEENIRNSDAVIIAFEMYSAANLDPSDEGRGWQAAFTDDLIELAHKNGKKVIFLSANLPYDTARFTKADAIVAAYCAVGMDPMPVDGQENPAYGVNYPAALITIFGGNSPTAKLPVDVFEVSDSGVYGDKIMYENGFGLTYKSEEEEAETTAKSEEEEAETTAEADEKSDDTEETSNAVTTAASNGNTVTTSGKVNADTSDSPKTGSAMPSIAVLCLVLAGSVAALSRKKD